MIYDFTNISLNIRIKFRLVHTGILMCPIDVHECCPSIPQNQVDNSVYIVFLYSNTSILIHCYNYTLFRMPNFELIFIWCFIGLKSILFKPTLVSFLPIGINLKIYLALNSQSWWKFHFVARIACYPWHVKIMISPLNFIERLFSTPPFCYNCFIITMNDWWNLF